MSTKDRIPVAKAMRFMHDVFLAHGVDAVFNGHYHTYFAGDYDGIEYTTLGSSGGYIDRDTPQPDIRGYFFQFGWATGALATTMLTDYGQPADEDQVWSIWQGNARVQR